MKTELIELVEKGREKEDIKKKKEKKNHKIRAYKSINGVMVIRLSVAKIQFSLHFIARLMYVRSSRCPFIYWIRTIFNGVILLIFRNTIAATGRCTARNALRHIIWNAR